MSELQTPPLHCGIINESPLQKVEPQWTPSAFGVDQQPVAVLHPRCMHVSELPQFFAVLVQPEAELQE
jgi:hypothetical protein